MQFFHGETVHPAARFLIGGEDSFNLSMGDFGVVYQNLQGGENLRHPSLIVGAQKGSPIGGYDGVTPVLRKIPMLLRIKAVLIIEADHPAVIILMDPGLHIFSGHVSSGVDVGHKTNYRSLRPRWKIGGQSGNQIPVFVKVNILQPQSLQFLRQGF